MNFTVITYSSMGKGVASKLIESCSVFGYPLTFIGQGTWFKDFRQIKIDLVLESLREVTTEYVMYTDAPDSWFLRDLFYTYKHHFRDKIVVSGNRDHYPVTELYDFTKESWPSDSSFRYICSSQFIGPTRKLIKLFEIMQQVYAGYVDQEAWQLLYVKKLAYFEIDSKCRLFLNMTQVTQEDLTDDWRLRETRCKPCSIHFGGAKGESPNGKLMELFFEKWHSEQH